jgi:hypothetical protein
MVTRSGQSGGPETIAPNVNSAAAAVKYLHGGVKAVMVRYSGGKWQYNLCDGKGTWVECDSQAFYDPPFYVRAVNLCDANNQNATLQYWVSGDGETAKNEDMNDFSYVKDVIEILATNVRHAESIRRIVFAGTTATYIVLHG